MTWANWIPWPGLKTQATMKNRNTAVRRFIVTPATITSICLGSEALEKARGSSESESSPSSRQKPPMGR